MCALYEAMLELQSNNLDKAERILQRTVQHFLKYKLIRYASEGINMLGDVHRKNGQFNKAERYYMNAIMKMEQINHPELIIPQLNLAILRVKKGEHQQVKRDLSLTIPALEANNKNTLALFARSILLLALVRLKEFQLAESNLNQIEVLLSQTQMIDTDIADLLEESIHNRIPEKFQQLKIRLLQLTIAQYKTLHRAQKHKELEELLKQINQI